MQKDKKTPIEDSFRDSSQELAQKEKDVTNMTGGNPDMMDLLKAAAREGALKQAALLRQATDEDDEIRVRQKLTPYQEALEQREIARSMDKAERLGRIFRKRDCGGMER